MRINQFIHPEVVLGYRGDAAVHKTLSKAMDFLGLRDGKICYTEEIGKRFDQTAVMMLASSFLFKRMRPKIYYTGTEFLKALMSIDREIPIDLLPSSDFFYLAFPKRVVSNGSEYLEGAYVWLSSKMDAPIALEKDTRITRIDLGESSDNDPYLIILGILEGHEKIGGAQHVILPLRKLKPSHFNDYLNSFEGVSSNFEGSGLLRAVLNCLLYIHSLEPNIEHLRPYKDYSHTQRSKLKAQGGKYLDDCLLPVTLLNWEYGQGKRYQLDSTWVKTHPRWQRCGPEFQQVKLIWVKEHERHFHKIDKGVESTLQSPY